MTEDNGQKEVRQTKEEHHFTKEEVMLLVRECVNRPKGVVPDIVYQLLPDIRF